MITEMKTSEKNTSFMLNTIHEAIDDIRNGKVGELYVDEVSRIGRDSLDCMKTLKVCEENKVNVVVENMGIASLIDGKPNSVFKIITGILSGISISVVI